MDKRQRGNFVIYLFTVLLILLNTAIFGTVWYIFYASHLYEALAYFGNYLVIGIYCLIYWYFAKLYGSFDLLVSKAGELCYSNAIALLATNAVMYCVIWLVTQFKLLNPLPLLITVIGGGIIDVGWAFLARYCVNKTVKPQRILIIYDNLDAFRNGKRIAKSYKNRFEVVDYICVDDEITEISATCDSILRHKVDAVMLCGIRSSQRNSLVKFCIKNSIVAYIRPNIGDLLIGESETFMLNHLPVLRCQEATPPIGYLFIKRTFDIVVSAIGLVVASPFMLATAIAVKAYDGGPVIFKQKRMTKNRKVFEVHKFRSMKVDADKGGKGIVTMQNDDRITPVGRFIRACRLDELPQLWDIFVGNMSIVGPRPERLETIELYEQEMPEFALRLQVKGGLTGYAQVYGKANTSPYDKLQMDLMYVGEQSISADIKIMLKTVKILFMPESTEGFAAELDAAKDNTVALERIEPEKDVTVSK